MCVLYEIVWVPIVVRIEQESFCYPFNLNYQRMKELFTFFKIEDSDRVILKMDYQKSGLFVGKISIRFIIMASILNEDL